MKNATGATETFYVIPDEREKITALLREAVEIMAESQYADISFETFVQTMLMYYIEEFSMYTLEELREKIKEQYQNVRDMRRWDEDECDE